MKLMLKRIMMSALTAIVIGVISLLLLPPMAKIYLWPGLYIGGAVARIIPSQLIYALVPDGGGPAFLLIAATSSIFFWTSLFAGIHTAYKRLNKTEIKT